MRGQRRDPFWLPPDAPRREGAAWSQEGLDEAGLGSLSGQWFPLGASPPPVPGAPTSLRVCFESRFLLAPRPPRALCWVTREAQAEYELRVRTCPRDSRSPESSKVAAAVAAAAEPPDYYCMFIERPGEPAPGQLTVGSRVRSSPTQG